MIRVQECRRLSRQELTYLKKPNPNHVELETTTQSAIRRKLVPNATSIVRLMGGSSDILPQPYTTRSIRGETSYP